MASSFDGIERCRERNYTARARGNRCSSENIQEATSWAGNTTVSKVSTIRKRWGRAEEAEKRTSFVDRKWRSELKTFLLSFFFFFCCYYFFLFFFLFHADIYFFSFLTLSRPAFSTSPSPDRTSVLAQLPSIFGGTLLWPFYNPPRDVVAPPLSLIRLLSCLKMMMIKDKI